MSAIKNFALACLVLIFASSALSAITVDEVIALSKGGVSADVILSQMAKDKTKFDLAVTDLLKLKEAGVPDAIVKAMVAGPTAGAAAAPAASVPAPATVATSVANGAAPVETLDVGIYTDKDGKWIEVMPEVVNWKTGGFLKAVATQGLVKGDLNGNLRGAHSKNLLYTPLRFRIVVQEGVSITEYQLLRLRENKNDREFRAVTGGIIHSSSGANRDLIEFEGTKVAPRTYDVTLPATVTKGEWGFLPPGANNASNGTSIGKMYSFQVVE